MARNILPLFRRCVRRRRHKISAVSVHHATMFLVLVCTFFTVRLLRPPHVLPATPSARNINITLHHDILALPILHPHHSSLSSPPSPVISATLHLPTHHRQQQQQQQQQQQPQNLHEHQLQQPQHRQVQKQIQQPHPHENNHTSLDPLRNNVDAIVGEGNNARAALTDVYAIPGPIVANMTHHVATRLYWKLLYTDILRALRSRHRSSAVPTSDDERPNFEARASVMFIHTQNGLGNRLRALASGLAIARATNRIPVVVWEKDRHLGAHLHDILHTDWLASDFTTVVYKDLIVMDSFPSWAVVARPRAHWHPVSYMAKDVEKKDNGELMSFQLPHAHFSTAAAAASDMIPSRADLPQSLTSPGPNGDAQLRFTRRTATPDHTTVLRGSVRGVIDLKKHVYFKSAYVARASPTTLVAQEAVNRELNALTPSVGVRHIVDRVQASSRLAGSYGVHIRSRLLADDNARVNKRCEYTRAGARVTDYWRSRSQPEVFMEKMQSVVQKEANATFFVATDNYAVMRLLESRFPGRISSISRNCEDRDGSCVLYAMADLICLSKTKSIFGSYWSSFSEAAWRMGGQTVYLSGRDFGKDTSQTWVRWTELRVLGTLQRWLAIGDPVYPCDGQHT